MRSDYEKPSIKAVDAAELIESVGPVQGYSGGGTGSTVETPLSSTDAGGRALGRN
jgi:hypothetical protein